MSNTDMIFAVESAEFLLRKIGQHAGPMQDSAKLAAEELRKVISALEAERSK